MKIINKTRNTVLGKDVNIADSPFSRMKGLLGKREFSKGQALLIKPCNSIHTFFMRFSIDVLFLDRDSRVIKVINCFRPFRFSAIYFKAASAIELPCGTIQSSSTQEGDEISLTP